MTPRPTPPPRLARWLIRVSAGPSMADAMLADLDEEFHRHLVPARGPTGARRWYWGQVLRSLLPNLVHRWERSRPGRAGGADPWGALAEIRFAVRGLARAPGLTGAVVATMGLGIGGAAFFYGVVHGVILHPFPFPDADRLVAVAVATPETGGRAGIMENLSPPEFLDIRASALTLRSMYAFDATPMEVGDAGGVTAVRGLIGWGDAFRTLGVEPHLGRGFRSDEMEPYGQPVLVLSHRLWVSRFGADSTLLGRTVQLDRSPYTVVGVMPPGIVLDDADVWRPGGSPPALRPRGPRRQFQVLARLADGASLASANRELEAIRGDFAARFAAQHPEYAHTRFEAVPWAEANVRDYRAVGMLLFASVAFLLLLICVNVASLFVARSLRRGREIAVRSALGASRARIAVALLTESVLVALAGGALGLTVAHTALRGADRMLSVLPEVHGSVSSGAPVLIFGLAAAALAGVLAGLVPALHGSRADVGTFLRTEGPGSTLAPGRLRALHTLVGVELAVTVLLLSGGATVATSYAGLARVDPGFDPAGLVRARIDLPGSEYGPAEVDAFYEELERRLRSLPGVHAAGVAFSVPPRSLGTREVALVGPRGEERVVEVPMTYASPGYAAALGLRLRTGRLPSESDAAGPAVAVVNESFVARYLAGSDPLGVRVRDLLEQDGPAYEVVGVVADVRNRGLGSDPAPEVFPNVRQAGGSKHTLYVVVRADGDPTTTVRAVEAVLSELDPALPLLAPQTFREALRRETAALRVGLSTFLVLVAVSVALAVLGVGGVVAFAAARRTREIGLRRALGAEEHALAWSVARATFRPAAWGVAVGVVAAAALVGPVVARVDDLMAPGPVLLAAVAAVACAVALVAAWRPAAVASRVDPMEVLAGRL